MQTARVGFISDVKDEYGFITPTSIPSEKDIYFHKSSCVSRFDRLRKGEYVLYVVEEYKQHKFRADNVFMLSDKRSPKFDYGTIASLLPNCGFICRGNGKDVYFEDSTCLQRFNHLNVGDNVEFVIKNYKPNLYRAERVNILCDGEKQLVFLFIL